MVLMLRTSKHHNINCAYRFEFLGRAFDEDGNIASYFFEDETKIP